MITRRFLLTTGAATALASGLQAQTFSGVLDSLALGLVPDSDDDQSQAFQAAVNTAAAQGLALQLRAGTYRVANISLPDYCVITGSAGRTALLLGNGETIFRSRKTTNVKLSGIEFQGNTGKNPDEATGLVYLDSCENFLIDGCRFNTSATQGIYAYSSGGRIIDCEISNIYGAAIASRNGTGLWIERNRIRNCGNLGVYIERGEPGPDGSVVSGNHISGIDWKEGGNGQNGNGINVYRADNVIVSDNIITDCAFSAVRLNATNDCQIIGNNCRNLSEVAIFSEFDFSGSIIANNIINEAAQGIAITNFNDNGRLSVCANNIVRNIWPSSPTNPDTTPVGIGIEADTTVTGNVVENVPGIGIALGWGPYMRDLIVSDNVVRDCTIGIGISVVDGVGNAVINDNLIQISGKQIAIAGTEWHDVAQPAMLENASNYPLLTMEDNHISR